jgi:hypothetical protein
MAEYPHNRGANLRAACVWTDSVGTPINITSVTFTAFEVVPYTLQDNVSFTKTDAVNGAFTINLDWSTEWPSGKGDVVKIGVQASNGQAFSFDVVLQ